MKFFLLLLIFTTSLQSQAKNQCQSLFLKKQAPPEYLNIGSIIRDMDRIEKEEQRIINYEMSQDIVFSSSESFTTENSPKAYLKNIQDHNNVLLYHDNFSYKFNFVLSNLMFYRNTLNLMKMNIAGASSQKVIDDFVQFYNDVEQTYQKYKALDFIYDDPIH
ncbi:hypothetical protein N9W41_00715 [bacterium]|nr:hypothetical protein [bacterium]